MIQLDPNIGTRTHEDFWLVENGVPTRRASEVLLWRTDEGERPSDEWLAASGYYGIVKTERPQIDSRTQKVSTPDIREWTVNSDAGVITQTWVITDLTAEEQEELTVREAATVRVRRLQLLAVSDYTQGLDFAGDRDSWATYRQQLRDLPTQAGFPWDVQWPVAP